MASSSTPILDKEHGDISYLKQDEIGLVLSKALSETYKAQPNDPVDFFAKFLLNHSRTAKKAKEVSLMKVVYNGLPVGKRSRESCQGSAREAPQSIEAKGTRRIGQEKESKGQRRKDREILRWTER